MGADWPDWMKTLGQPDLEGWCALLVLPSGPLVEERRESIERLERGGYLEHKWATNSRNPFGSYVRLRSGYSWTEIGRLIALALGAANLRNPAPRMIPCDVCMSTGSRLSGGSGDPCPECDGEGEVPDVHPVTHLP